jgi:hypothetical protein
MTHAALNPHVLQQQKALFEDVLVKEILAELRFCGDVVANRSQERKGFTEKLVTYISMVTIELLNLTGVGVSVAFPGAGSGLFVASTAMNIGSGVINAGIGQAKAKKTAGVANLSATDVNNLLEVCLRHFAKAASLRYEPLLAMTLSDKPEESVVPLGRIGARRVVDFLKRHLNATTDVNQLQDIDLLLDGLIQGHSGNGVDGFKNNRLMPRQGKASLTVEGALGRPAMRLIDNSLHYDPAQWPIYYRETPLHQAQGVDKRFSWGRTTFNKHKHFLHSKAKPEYGPKYGYLLVDDNTRQRYGYNSTFSQAINTALEYTPSVCLATREMVDDYLAYCQQHPGMHFLDYVNAVYHTQFSHLWVRSMHFEKMAFSNVNFAKVDFAGCSFKNVTMTQADFSQANLAFISAEGLTCQDVSFNQTDFSFAKLKQVSFSHVSIIDAKWLGTELQEVDSRVAATISQEQETQTKLAEENRQAFDAMHKRIRALEQEQLNRVKEMASKEQALLDKVRDELADNKGKLQQEIDEIKAQAREFEQNAHFIVNAEAFKEECELKINHLQADVSELRTGQQAYQQQQQQAIHSLKASITLMQQQLSQRQENNQNIQAHLQSKLEMRTSILDDARITGAVDFGDIDISGMHADTSKGTHLLGNRQMSTHMNTSFGKNLQASNVRVGSFTSAAVSISKSSTGKPPSLFATQATSFSGTPRAPLTLSQKQLLTETRSLLDAVCPEHECDEEGMAYRMQHLNFLNSLTRRLTDEQERKVHALMEELDPEHAYRAEQPRGLNH